MKPWFQQFQWYVFPKKTNPLNGLFPACAHHWGAHFYGLKVYVCPTSLIAADAWNLERVFRRKAVFKCGRNHDIWRFLKSCEIPKSPWVSILKWSNHRMIWEYPYDLGNLHLDTFIGDYNLWPTLFSNKLLTPMDANTEHEFKMNSKPNES